MPPITLLLAKVILQEDISYLRLFLSAVLVIILEFIIYIEIGFINAVLLIISPICFSLLDIINKKYIFQQDKFNIIMYSSCICLILSLPFSIYFWHDISYDDLILTFFLGVISSLILFCILYSYHFLDIQVTMTFRYIELLISITIGYLLFYETIPNFVILFVTIVIFMDYLIWSLTIKN